MKKILYVVITLFLHSYIFAQNEGNIWYFGSYAGIDFNMSPPVALLDGQLNTQEGCATICDNTGSLLFYTDGMKIWNKNHDIMPNGSNLLGHWSSTQSAIIVKKPGSNPIYYVFTLEHQAYPNGLRYSEVDMSLQGGLGDVNANKNVLVVTPTCEKIAAIKHQNNTDFWIVTHLWNSDAYHSYLLTSSGLSTVPVVSNVGSIFIGDINYTIGYLKASTDGNRIASAKFKQTYSTPNTENVEVFDFDKATGVISNPITLYDFGQRGPYGVEFSPCGDFLYVAETNLNISYTYQYNLLAGSASAINNSRIKIDSVYGKTGALQVGPDKRIYHAVEGYNYLCVIENPDILGIGCNYVKNGIFLEGRSPQFGLPNLFNSIVSCYTEFTYSKLCYGDSTAFLITTLSLDSVLWDFGDILGGVNNTSRKFAPKHLYSGIGIFVVTLISYSGGIADTTIKTLNISPAPFVNLGNDTILCQGSSMILDATFSNATYLWQDNSTNTTFNVIHSGTYWVDVSLNTCSTSDSIVIIYDSILSIDSISINMCWGDSIFIGGQFQNSSGIYYDTLQNVNSCDSIIITTLSFSEPSNSHIYISICDGDSIFAGGDYQSTSGTYCDTLMSIIGCDSIVITDLTVGDTYFVQSDTTICDGDSIFLNGSYQTHTGTYIDSLQSVYYCDSIIYTNLSVESYININLGNDTVLDVGDSIILDAGSNYLSYLWSDGSTGTTLTVNITGVYCVRVTSNCGNIDYDTISIKIGYSISGKVTYDDTLKPNQPITNILLILNNINGVTIDSTITDLNGDYQFNNLAGSTYYIQTICTKQWGGGSVNDALMIMSHFAKIIQLTGLKFMAGDIDGSGSVNATDALYLAQRFVFMISYFPIGDWVFENNTITVNGGDVVYNFKGLSVGDVNGSYIVP